MIGLNDSVTLLKGVGASRKKQLEALGIQTVGDLLRHYPRTYEDRSKVTPILEACGQNSLCISAVVGTKITSARLGQGRTLSKCRVFDDTASLEVTFFNRNYLERQLITGQEYIFYGKVSQFGGKLQMTNPDFEGVGVQKVTGRILPVYPLTSGITRYFLAGLVTQALAQLGEIAEYISQDILSRNQLCGIDTAIRNIHFPSSHDMCRNALNRLAFEELLVYTTALSQIKANVKKHKAPKMHPCDLDTFYRLLPFEPTNAQKNAIDQIQADMCSTTPMNRLIQGDVGSGKTVVAAAAVYLAATNHYQSAVMVPTEILATQHFSSLEPLLSAVGIRSALLLGSTPQKEKKETLSRVESGDVHLIIGTHALLESKVAFKSPALFVIDEQHRFGVNQRAKLTDKGIGSHVLVMSATPIPRTLTLIIYGELDVSILDEMPPGRQNVDTFGVDSSYDTRLAAFIDKQIVAGGQVYVVCPLALESEDSDLSSAQEYAQRLSRLFPKYKVGMLHGKLKAVEKEQVMSAFNSGDISILVSTTVIEVGVNVPRATLMIVRNAERFGLSQLHQLRGRVGRGMLKSYCVLVSDHKSQDTKKRLGIMTQTNDGFAIAQEDLKIRGPGDFFGMAQHGLPQYSAICSCADIENIQAAQRQAIEIIKNDGKLTQHPWLAERVAELRSKISKSAFN